MSYTRTLRPPTPPTGWRRYSASRHGLPEAARLRKKPGRRRETHACMLQRSWIMAQRHVLMMLAAAATSFLEGESDRAETGSAKGESGWNPDRRRRTRADASIRKTGVEKTPVVTGAAEQARHRECRVTGLSPSAYLSTNRRSIMTNAYKRTTLLAAILAGTALATAGCGDRNPGGHHKPEDGPHRATRSPRRRNARPRRPALPSKTPPSPPRSSRPCWPNRASRPCRSASIPRMVS